MVQETTELAARCVADCEPLDWQISFFLGIAGAFLLGWIARHLWATRSEPNA